MKTISVMDISISSYNLGNQIIMESVFKIIDELFPDDFLFTLPWEGAISKTAHRYLRKSDHVFFGGTNSLSSHLLTYKQFGFRLRDLIRFNHLTLLGMGWWQYQGRPDLYTRLFIRRLLSDRVLHSVRDEYTKKKLEDIGIRNVLNTCCPTTWGLTPEHCSEIPHKKSSNVIITLTDYNKSRQDDAKLLRTLSDSYNFVFYWVQGSGDLEYINSFDELRGKIKIVSPKLQNYEFLLRSNNLDYIGTRLHAGIKAIQRKKRSIILAVDNRASEIANDIGLNIAQRYDIDAVKNFIESSYETKLQIPFAQIDKWKAQFSGAMQ